MVTSGAVPSINFTRTVTQTSNIICYVSIISSFSQNFQTISTYWLTIWRSICKIVCANPSRFNFSGRTTSIKTCGCIIIFSFLTDCDKSVSSLFYSVIILGVVTSRAVPPISFTRTVTQTSNTIGCVSIISSFISDTVLITSNSCSCWICHCTIVCSSPSILHFSLWISTIKISCWLIIFSFLTHCDESVSSLFASNIIFGMITSRAVPPINFTRAITQSPYIICFISIISSFIFHSK